MTTIKSESQIAGIGTRGSAETYYMVANASNLQLRVRATGAKAWLYRKQIRGKRARMSLGSWPVVNLAKAKAKAASLDVAAYEGDDIWAAHKKLSGPRSPLQRLSYF